MGVIYIGGDIMRKGHAIRGYASFLPKRTKTFFGILLALAMILASVSVSMAAVAFSNMTASRNDTTVTVSFTVSGAPAAGMEVTLLVMEKTNESGPTPPSNIENRKDVVYIDQKTMMNGANNFTFKISDSLKNTPLRVYIGGNNGATVAYADIAGNQLGDVNGDGKINIGDVDLLYQYVRGRRTLAAEQIAASDVNKDGKINIGDVDRLYQFIRGRIPNL